jgi:hypothetical protein
MNVLDANIPLFKHKSCNNGSVLQFEAVINIIDESIFGACFLCDYEKEVVPVNLVCSTEPPVTRFSSRRKSVFAETYNPEEDEDDDEGAKVGSA